MTYFYELSDWYRYLSFVLCGGLFRLPFYIAVLRSEKVGPLNLSLSTQIGCTLSLSVIESFIRLCVTLSVFLGCLLTTMSDP